MKSRNRHTVTIISTPYTRHYTVCLSFCLCHFVEIWLRTSVHFVADLPLLHLTCFVYGNFDLARHFDKVFEHYSFINIKIFFSDVKFHCWFKQWCSHFLRTISSLLPLLNSFRLRIIHTFALSNYCILPNAAHCSDTQLVSYIISLLVRFVIHLGLLVYHRFSAIGFQPCSFIRGLTVQPSVLEIISNYHINIWESKIVQVFIIRCNAIVMPLKIFCVFQDVIKRFVPFSDTALNIYISRPINKFYKY